MGDNLTNNPLPLGPSTTLGHCQATDCQWLGCTHHVHRKWGRLTYHYAHLCMAADAGCSHCSIVRQLLDQVCHCKLEPPSSELVNHVGVTATYDNEYDTARLTLKWTCGRCSVDIQSLPPPEDPRDIGSSEAENDVAITERELPVIRQCHRDVQEDPLSSASLKMYTDWLRECDESHDICSGLGVGNLPTRLLSVDQAGVGDTIRLMESIGSSGQYAALSYCWGGVEPPTTTITNLQDHQRGIVLADLPRTYQDAIRLTRALKIPYLWIDSLCIIQDDEADRDFEVSRMGQVFQDAYVAIVAADSETVEVGFLSKRTECSWSNVNIIRSGFPDHTLQIRSGGIDLEVVDYANGDAPISRRGWCFQEHLLARRCIVFTSKQALWECRNGCESESRHAKTLVEENDYAPPFLPVLGPPHVVSAPRRHFATTEEAYDFWRRAVTAYSNRALSISTDRLPAIAALATAVQSATGSEYLAGLWRADLLRQLTWMPGQTESFRARPGVYVAPSWSWASLPHVCWYPHKVDQFEPDAATRVIEAWCQPSRGNSLGAVDSGAIMLEAPCAFANIQRLSFGSNFDRSERITIIGRDHSFVIQGNVYNGHRLDFSYDYFSAAAVNGYDKHLEASHASAREDSQEGEQPRLADVCLLRLGNCPSKQFYLVLGRSQRAPESFERLALLNMDFSQYNEDGFRDLKELEAASTILQVKII